MKNIIYILYYILISIIIVIVILYITFYENPQNKSLSSLKAYFFSNKDKLNILAIESLDRFVNQWLKKPDELKDHPNRIYDILRSYYSYYSIYYNDETIKNMIPSMISIIKNNNINPILLISILYIYNNTELNEYFYLKSETIQIDNIENAFYVFMIHRLVGLSSDRYIKSKYKLNELNIIKHLDIYVLLHIFNNNNIIFDNDIINKKSLKKFSTKYIYKITKYLNIIPIKQENAYNNYLLICYIANLIFNNSLSISKYYNKNNYNDIIKSAKIIKYYASLIPHNYLQNIIKYSNPIITDTTIKLINRSDFSIFKPKEYIFKYNKNLIISTLSEHLAYMYLNKLYIQCGYNIITVDVNLTDNINTYIKDNIAIIHNDTSIIILYKYLTTISKIHHISGNNITVDNDTININNYKIYIDKSASTFLSSDFTTVSVIDNNQSIIKYFSNNYNVKLDNDLITINNFLIKK
ncbi:ORF MSV055 hypothetical protein [Melanoplus sanguinipes entomopoxvirus]|uniref:Uncharacterized protein n=1 Tax=Melanoplus sanguinipes entomopoxvirus TaxID=83191 RepID=Q9YW37_MSEPV|nr:ORF MSV055 hypothetical protein [Melanoplus sanguinipes entomopoxvirus]AAC97822.1 ORF MSV055 hypothetical protein [Melanoplus sanguinipes entomopoxvirus 'O']